MRVQPSIAIRTLAALPKSIIFNLRYFKFRQAVRLPVLVSHRVWLRQLSGTVQIPPNSGFGTVRIGFGDIGIFDRKRFRSIWQVRGAVTFRGRCSFGHGSKISVSGQLSVGHGAVITAESTIVAKQSVTIGDNVLISWDVLIMDTDLHKVTDLSGKVLNHPKPVAIGGNVWIGCRTTILKGAEVAAGSVVAANALVTRSFVEENCLIGGNPATCLKTNVTWAE